jgi:hypothetical protein
MENFEIVLKLSLAEANVILAGIGKLPIEMGLAVLEKIKSQAELQIQAAQANVMPIPDSEH